MVTIKLPGFLQDKNQNISLSIINIIGKLVKDISSIRNYFKFYSKILDVL